MLGNVNSTFMIAFGNVNSLTHGIFNTVNSLIGTTFSLSKTTVDTTVSELGNNFSRCKTGMNGTFRSTCGTRVRRDGQRRRTGGRRKGRRDCPNTRAPIIPAPIRSNMGPAKGSLSNGKASSTGKVSGVGGMAIGVSELIRHFRVRAAGLTNSVSEIGSVINRTLLSTLGSMGLTVCCIVGDRSCIRDHECDRSNREHAMPFRTLARKQGSIVKQRER